MGEFGSGRVWTWASLEVNQFSHARVLDVDEFRRGRVLDVAVFWHRPIWILLSLDLREFGSERIWT